MDRTTTLDRAAELITGPYRHDFDHLLSLPAEQQPAWEDPWVVGRVRSGLGRLPGLVSGAEVSRLGERLAEVAAGRALVVQAGDCAEDPAECGSDAVRGKVELLDALAEVLESRAGLPVLRVGRIAGQFAKPRSQATETVDGTELPSFRGLIVNRPEPDPASRRPDPLRMLACYQSADKTLRNLRVGGLGSPAAEPLAWASHEALLLDYEIPLLRRTDGGQTLLTSTHWPWIGDRTRQLDGAHVQMLADVANPVACKVGPGMDSDELVELCRRLDPGRQPGRLTLIARFGPELTARRLPALAAAVREAGHPAIWLCDPMHANTVTAADGRKTRLIDTIVREVHAFCAAMETARAVGGGLHLETTPDDVVECLPSVTGRRDPGHAMLCDPRLNRRQALDVAAAWNR